MLPSPRLPFRSILGGLMASCAVLELLGFSWYELAVIATVMAAGLSQVAADTAVRDPITTARVRRR